jgi:hypothetical protein
MRWFRVANRESTTAEAFIAASSWLSTLECIGVEIYLTQEESDERVADTMRGVTDRESVVH